MKFTAQENKVLSETYRRLNYFHSGNLDEKLLLLSRPNKVKTLKEKGILKPYSKEIHRALNWYNLTEAGKLLFKNHITKHRLSEETNYKLFNEDMVINFSK